jgi:hypothetical protein
MTIRILEPAKRDLINGFVFYEQQTPGLGDYFLDSLFSDIDSLLIYSGIHPIKFDDYYCMLAKRFPFAIYYSIKGNEILVDAVFDCRRNPDRLKDRLG